MIYNVAIKKLFNIAYTRVLGLNVSELIIINNFVLFGSF